MVVSEMGELWSPNTPPPRTAARDVIVRWGATWLQTIIAIGISIPKAPQEVPMAKERPAAVINSIAGIIITGKLDCSTRPAT
jgi:hypothetical protein